MINKFLNLRIVVAIVATCLVSATIFSGCNKNDEPSNTANPIADKYFNLSNSNYQSGQMPSSASAQPVGTLSGNTNAIAGSTMSVILTSDIPIQEFYLGVQGVSGYLKVPANVSNAPASSQTMMMSASLVTASGGSNVYNLTLNISRNLNDGFTLLVGGQSGDGDILNSISQVISNSTAPPAEAVELTNPITTNTTLTDLGSGVDYYFTGGELSVENNAILTIDPGVTIQFRNSSGYGYIHIKQGSTIKAIGTASKRIQFVGAYEAAGTWDGITIESNTDNQLAYCDLLDAGRGTGSAALYLYNAKVGVSHCKMTNGVGTGVYANCDAIHIGEFSKFDNNVIEGFDNQPPMILKAYESLTMLSKLDMTSDFTNNAKPYVEISPTTTKDVTISQTTVPYYFDNAIWNLANVFTINEGITIYMAGGADFITSTYQQAGRLMISGTTAKPVKFTRLPNSSYYWSGISFSGLKGSVINNCTFEYGGYISGSYHGYYFYITSGSELTLNNVQLNNAQAYGVYIGACPGDYILNHTNVTFSGNGEGNVEISCSGTYIVDDLP